MTAAVRTILDCIGEDPDREGLLRTPERYAQAIMWMTKGYEERLAGTTACPSQITFRPNSCPQISSMTLFSLRTMKKWL